MIDIKLDTMPSEDMLQKALKRLTISEAGEEDFRGTSSLRIYGEARAIREVALALNTAVHGYLQRLCPSQSGTHEVHWIFDASNQILFVAIAVDSSWESVAYPVRNLIFEQYIVRLAHRRYELLFTSHQESLMDLRTIILGEP